MSRLILPIVVEADANGYFVYCRSLQGCYSQRDSDEEANISSGEPTEFRDHRLRALRQNSKRF
jgi:hypothetical protein